MKFPNGELMKCWYCGHSFKSDKEHNNIICPECGKTLKTFQNDNKKTRKKAA